MYAKLADDCADAVALVKGGSTRITFDDLDLDGSYAGVIPNGYAGLNWKAAVMDGQKEATSLDAPTCGYATGVTSGRQALFDGGGGDVEVSANGTFDMKSVQLTAVWDKALTIEIIGYKDGKVVDDIKAHVTDKGPTLVDIGFKGVDEVKFKQLKGVEDPKQPHTGKHFVIDDMAVANIHHGNAAPTSASTHALGSVANATFAHELLAGAPLHGELHHMLAIA